MKNSIKRFFNNVKTTVSNFLHWKSESVGIWILKVALLALCGCILYVFFKLADVLLPILLLLLLFNFDKINAFFSSPAPDAGVNDFSVREFIFRVLQDAATQLNLIAPRTVNDIMPVYYPAKQSIGGVPFCRFICQPKADEPVERSEWCDFFNLRIVQMLQNGFPGLFPSYYNGAPALYLFNVQTDSSHAGFLCIDVVFVSDASTYAFASRHYARNHAPSAAGTASPLDEDF